MTNRMVYFGWQEDWLDDLGNPKVSEFSIHKFVNRYFVFPDDWEDDTSLIMVWSKCVTCGMTKEQFVVDNEESAKDFLFNEDNTFVCLYDLECDNCNSVPNGVLEPLREKRFSDINTKYVVLTFRAGARAKNMKFEPIEFESPLEEIFWKAWQVTFCTIPLVPQYQIDNYFVDFAHIPTKTVIEIDGRRYHSSQSQRDHDRTRQVRIEQQGWRFIRFDGTNVAYRIDRCLFETLRFLAERNSSLLSVAQDLWLLSPSERVRTYSHK